MALRKYNAPNVEYNEIDRSQYGTRTAAVGTMSFVAGFADKGDDYDIKYSDTFEDFIASYGYPTNEAERYFFNAAYEAFKMGGRLASAKIPYMNESLDKFAFTMYKLVVDDSSPAKISDDEELNEALSSVDQTITSYIKIESIDNSEFQNYFDIDNGLMGMSTYDDMLINSLKTQPDTIVIVDISRNKYSKDPNLTDVGTSITNRYLGYVPVIVTPLNALKFQNLIRLSSNMVSPIGLQTIPSLTSINQIPDIEGLLSTSFEIPLASDGKIFSESVEKIAAQQFPLIKFSSNSTLDRKYLKQIGIVVFKMYVDVSNNKKINFSPVEAFIGSLNKKDKDLITNKSIFIEDVVNQNSQLINVFTNVNFSNTIRSDESLDSIKLRDNPRNLASTYYIKDQTITTLGFFDSQCTKLIDVETIDRSLNRIFEKAKDPNSVPIDIVVDAGITNIAQHVQSTSISGDGIDFYEPEYDTKDTVSLDVIGSTDTWKRFVTKYDDFVKNVRKDCIYIADGPRALCLIGNEKVIRKTAPENTITNSLIPYVKKMIAIDSSYSAGYCDWFKCFDYTSRDYFWCPPSIKAMGVYLYTDRYANTWDAPAGDNRGRIEDAVDIAFNPTVEEAQYFYTQQWNYAMAFPMTGIVLEGQKTFQTEQTALDRVNVRRLCNAIKKGVKEIARHYLYEKITDQTMTNVRDRINDFLGRIKNLDGISEYFIKLDHENNTVETIERNELHVAFAIRPIKTLEFIIINGVLSNQSADLEEVVQSVLQ